MNYSCESKQRPSLVTLAAAAAGAGGGSETRVVQVERAAEALSHVLHVHCPSPDYHVLNLGLSMTDADKSEFKVRVPRLSTFSAQTAQSKVL